MTDYQRLQADGHDPFTTVVLQQVLLEGMLDGHTMGSAQELEKAYRETAGIADGYDPHALIDAGHWVWAPLDLFLSKVQWETVYIRWLLRYGRG